MPHLEQHGVGVDETSIEPVRTLRAQEIKTAVVSSSKNCAAVLEAADKTWRRHAGRASRKRTPWCASDTSPGIGTWPPPISPASEMVWWGARHGRVVTNAVRSPVRPATRWIRVVSRASARVIAGRIVVSRRASIDLPAPGGPRRRRFWTERLHHLQLHPTAHATTCWLIVSFGALKQHRGISRYHKGLCPLNFRL